jgi:hypothetical protein
MNYELYKEENVIMIKMSNSKEILAYTRSTFRAKPGPENTAPASTTLETDAFTATNLNAGGQWTLGALNDADFAVGSTMISASATEIGSSSVPHHGAVLVSGHGLNIVEIIGDTNGGGGIGSTVTLYGIREAGTLRWLVKAFMCGQGTGAVKDSSAFGANKS